MDVGTIDVMVAQYLRERGHSVAFLAMLDDETNVTDAAVSPSHASEGGCKLTCTVNRLQMTLHSE